MLTFALTSGCAPIVQHGPWVRRGISGTAGGTAGVASDLIGGTAASPYISLDAGVRAGIAEHDSSRIAGALGLQLPMLSIALLTDIEDPVQITEFVSLDGYVAIPLLSGLHTAAGFTRSSLHSMPYIQIGAYERWFGTLAVMSMHRNDLMLIAPSFTSVERLNRGTVLHLTATVGAGRDHEDETILMFGFGVQFEFHRKHASP